MTITYCNSCVLPSSAATPITFDENGVCSGCRVHEERPDVNWGRRMEMLRELCDDYKTDNYDIVIPVSGGKDSYFQTHVAVKELGPSLCSSPIMAITFAGGRAQPDECGMSSIATTSSSGQASMCLFE